MCCQNLLGLLKLLLNLFRTTKIQGLGLTYMILEEDTFNVDLFSGHLRTNFLFRTWCDARHDYVYIVECEWPWASLEVTGLKES